MSREKAHIEGGLGGMILAHDIVSDIDVLT